MPQTLPGARVGAIQSSDETTVRLYGYGVYDGEHEPPFGPMGMSLEEHKAVVGQMIKDGMLPDDYVWKNPRITLDDGGVVWGCQCWWGPEEVIKRKIGDRKVEIVKPDA